ncbi:Gfo/Idh/MocA family oxidoreductase [candidate division KSB1 bacterium]|nr:Gfo/Idh/MocA family oxidoreductase [candidate division KSB1 bacterium]
MKNFAIVGINNYAQKYIKIIEKLRKEGFANLFCVVVRDRDKNPKVVRELDDRGIVVYSSLDKMLSYCQTKVDIVALPVASKDHAELAGVCLEAGYDVILERPAAITIQDVNRLLEIQKKTDRYCIVSNEFLYSSSINLICNEIGSGRLGKIKRIRTLCASPMGTDFFSRNNWAGKLYTNNQWNLDGPATNYCAEVLQNALFLIESVCGRQVTIKSVEGELYRSNEISSYDTASIRVIMDDESEIFFAASYAVDAVIEPAMHIDCENGTVDWNYDNEKTIIRYADGRKKIFRERDIEQRFEIVFRDAITVTTTRARKPNSTLETAASHVLVLNLAFESAEEIVTIPPEYLQKTKNNIIIQNNQEIFKKAYTEAKLFSEMDLPWAKSSKVISGKNYTSFPQNAKLKKLMKDA